MLMRKLLIILGTPIDDINMDEALNRMEDFIAAGRVTGKGHQIATVNADFVVKSLHDAELRRILQEADMATADGMPLVWSARLLGVPIEGRVTGADMVPALAERAAQKGFSIYFLGAAPGVAKKAAQILQQQYPSLKIAGIASPSPEEVQQGNPAIIAACKAAKPDILLVAFGNPKQEKWIYRHAQELGVPVMIGVGGTFDFIAGVTKRAPYWMQQSGLEWIYRLLQQPGRLWKRYTTDFFGFGYFFLWQWWIMQQKNSSTPLLPTSELITVRETVIMNVKGRLDRSNQDSFMEKAYRALAEQPYLVVNLAQTDFLDSSAIGTLVALCKQARERGGNLWLVNVPHTIQQVLSLLRLDQFFTVCPTIEEALQDRHQWRMAKVTHYAMEQGQNKVIALN
ncbi:MAG: WecB/TagA/CpsF family glycosyltransferase [Caldilineaceae bacterium]|nr:WecB/TagA/CpsF family glycosyltransferase [Caldilineaceae bacterium]